MHARHQRRQLLAGNRLDHVVQTTGIFLERVVRLKNRRDLTKLGFRRRWDKERSECCVIAMKLLFERRDSSLRAKEREQHPLLDGDMAQQAAPESIVRVAVTDAETPGEQCIEALVIVREKRVQFAAHAQQSCVLSSGRSRSRTFRL